jgi:4-amino-4-deoxy-L-arabinose transferase-like glycosyltransferase
VNHTDNLATIPLNKDKSSIIQTCLGPRFCRLELMALLLPLGFAAHCLWLRIHALQFPSGDEGSWLAVAAQWSRGEGFTTRWLEHHWQLPYVLPRPDDFRYPGLTLIIGSVFRVFGISYTVALYVISSIFLTFITSVFASLRRRLGFWAAFGAACLAAASPLQLQWNSAVYTEGLFGLFLALWVYLALVSQVKQTTWEWWCLMGFNLGLLTLIRPNALLMFSALVYQFVLNHRRHQLPWNRIVMASLVCVLVISPWLIRNWIFFENPFHIAGSAGLLRDRIDQTHLLGVGQYLQNHSWLFPIKRWVFGIGYFFTTLHFLENGLEVLPLMALFGSILFTKDVLFSPLLGASFLISFAACAFASWHSWAGVRYFSAYLPFLYGFGIFYTEVGLSQLKFKKPLHGLMLCGVILVFLSPVINAHRYYERKYHNQRSAAAAIEIHLKALEKWVPANGAYYAKNLCQLNFLTDRHCIGLQELYDSTWFGRSKTTFQPTLIALRRDEEGTSDVKEALSRYRAAGFIMDTVLVLDSTWYIRLIEKARGEEIRMR